MNPTERRKVKCRSFKEQYWVKVSIKTFISFLNLPRSTFYRHKNHAPEKLDKLFDSIDIKKFKKWYSNDIKKRLLSDPK